MPRIFYVTGASGAGKDSLIRYARTKKGPESKIAFAHRYITRPADAGGENHIALSVSEFIQRRDAGCFVMNWQSHDLYYGIGLEIECWLERGLSVVINGSREYLSQAARRYPDLVPVLISVRPEILVNRLKARGRETEAQIDKRVSRAVMLDTAMSHPALVRIDNNTDIEEAGEAFLRILDEPELHSN